MTRIPKIIAIHSRAPSAERILGPALRPEDKGKPWIEDVRWFFAIGAVMADNGTRREISYHDGFVMDGYSLIAFCKGFCLGDQSRAPMIQSLCDMQLSENVKGSILAAGFSCPVPDETKKVDVIYGHGDRWPLGLIDRVNPSGLLILDGIEGERLNELGPWGFLPNPNNGLTIIPKP